MTTVPSSGAPHTTAAWFLVEDGTFKCSWEPTKQKVPNLVRDPRCTVMLLDPTDPLRSLEIRAVATVTHDADLEFRRRVGVRFGFPIADESPPHVVVSFFPTLVDVDAALGQTPGAATELLGANGASGARTLLLARIPYAAAPASRTPLRPHPVRRCARRARQDRRPGSQRAARTHRRAVDEGDARPSIDS